MLWAVWGKVVVYLQSYQDCGGGTQCRGCMGDVSIDARPGTVLFKNQLALMGA